MMSRLGWNLWALLGAIFALGLGELSWVFPFGLVGLAFVYVVLPCVGWYAFFHLFLTHRWNDTQRSTDVRATVNKRALAAILAVVATTAWLLFKPSQSYLGLLFVPLSITPLVALSWWLGGLSSEASQTSPALVTWLRRIVATGLVLIIPHLVLPTHPGYTDYYFHWPRYHRVIYEIRSDNLEPGECRYYLMRDSYLYLYLEALPQEDDATAAPLTHTGVIQAYRTERGSLLVAIITANFHHGGTFGYLYADERAHLERHEGCLRVLDNANRRALNRHWETFRWD